MRRLVYIPALIMLYLLLTAKSCDNQEQADANREESRITATKDSIIDVFESEALSVPSLRAFEAAARLKLYDLQDYLLILADSSIEKGFKTKVEEMIRAIFIQEDENFPLHADNINNLNVSGVVDFDSVKIQKPLKWISDSLYSGQLRFLVHYPLTGKPDRKVIQDKEKYIDIYVVKREKAFGHNSLKVWTVLFGDID